MKQVKRTLRAKSTKKEKRLQIPTETFSGLMEELQESQLTYEGLREEVRNSLHLFSTNEAQAFAVDCLHYAARYLHDVFQDFEKQRGVIPESELMTIDCRAVNIFDFLKETSAPSTYRDPWDTDGQLDKSAVRETLKSYLAKDANGRRYRKVYYYCLQHIQFEIRATRMSCP